MTTPAPLTTVIDGVPHTAVRLRPVPVTQRVLFMRRVAETMHLSERYLRNSDLCCLCARYSGTCNGSPCGDAIYTRFVRDDAIPYLALEGVLE